MSNLPDHERIGEIIKRLDEIQRESELLRAKIEGIRTRRVEFPTEGAIERLLDGGPATGDVRTRVSSEE